MEAGGARVSSIGVGTWQFGAREWGYGEGYAAVTAGEIVRRALELGVNLFDTAEIYGFGRSERILGEALNENSWRDKAFVATKFWPLIPASPFVQQRAKASAERLGMERIDLYQMHWPNPVLPFGPFMSGLRSLKEAGRIDHAGVSNFDLDGWKRAEEAFGEPILSNQVSFSLANLKPLRRLIPWAQENDRIVIAYSPLAQGLLGGRYDEQNRPSDLRAANRMFLPESLRSARPLIEALREIARRHEAKPAQVALAWIVSHSNVVAIPGASSVDQMESNAAAADLELTDEEQARLLEAAEGFEPPSLVSSLPGVARSLLGRIRGGS